MSTGAIRLVRGDTRTRVLASLTDDTSGAALNLTGSTVRLLLRPLGGASSFALPGTILNAATGQVAFAPGASAELQQAGALEFNGEVEVTFPDGSVQSVYELFRVRFREGL